MPTKQRIQQVAKEKQANEVRSFYEELTKKMGRVPNIFLLMGNSPQTLSAFKQLS